MCKEERVTEYLKRLISGMKSVVCSQPIAMSVVHQEP